MRNFSMVVVNMQTISHLSVYRRCTYSLNPWNAGMWSIFPSRSDPCLNSEGSGTVLLSDVDSFTTYLVLSDFGGVIIKKRKPTEVEPLYSISSVPERDILNRPCDRLVKNIY